MTTTTVLVTSVAAVVVVYAIWVGIPIWMLYHRPDTPPDTTLPAYLAARDESIPELQPELTGGHR
jgi:hypothetical protein